MSSGGWILTAGRFGEAVGQRCVREGGADSSMPLSGFVARAHQLDGHPRFLGVAAWRRYGAELEAIDAWCWELGVTWTQVVLEGAVLMVGPLVAPGRSACHRCFRARWLSNSAIADRELALDAAYELDGRCGPAGFTPGLVRIGAALLESDLQAGAAAAGRTRWFDIRTGSLSEEAVIRVHGCGRCAPQRTPGSRYSSELRRVLARRT